MKKILSLDIPEIDVEKQKLFYVNNKSSERKELLLDVNKKTNGDFSLSFKDSEGNQSVAKMSYKILGGKFAKHVLINDGLDFFFTYNKSNGYFNKKNILIEEDDDISNISMEKFYAGVIDVLKKRFVLGYLGSDIKNQPTEKYFRDAHKYIVCKKYGLTNSQCMNFIKQIIDKSFFPDKFFDGFLSELHKSIYEGELSKGDVLKIDTIAKLSLLNEKKAKYSFFDNELHRKILKSIRDKEDMHNLNAIALMEALQNIK